MPKTEAKKKGLKLPHQLVILFIIAALATLATYIVPAGVYDSIEMDGRKVIDAASFHYIDQTPRGALDGPVGPARRLCEERGHHRHDHLHRRGHAGHQRHPVH